MSSHVMLLTFPLPRRRDLLLSPTYEVTCPDLIEELEVGEQKIREERHKNEETKSDREREKKRREKED